MTHEKLTRALYDWCLLSARVQDVPMGMKALSWDELAVQDKPAAERWRQAVDFLLAELGWDGERGEELVFDGVPLVAHRRLAEICEAGEDHRITPDGG